jgi:hypothetical protein
MHRLLLLVILGLCSCAPAYVSNSRNTPMFGEAGEFAGSVVLASGVEAHLAGSLTDNLAVMASGQAIFQKYTEPVYEKDYYFYEGGLGYYGRSRAGRYEVFAGYGRGQGNSYDSYYFFQTASQAVVTQGKFQRIFIQPSFGTNNKKLNLIFSARVSMVNFTEFSTDDPIVTPAALQTYSSSGFHVVFEPSLITRFHLAGNLHGFFQLNINQPMPNDADFGHVPLQAAIGIQVHTGQLRTNVYR